VLAIVLGIAVIAIAAAWFVPPLGTGDAGVASGPPESEQTTDSSNGAVQITYVPSGRVAYGVVVRNTTFVPVVIDGLHGAETFILDDVRLVLGNGASYLGLEDDHIRAFTPITLAPGDTQLIGLIGRFAACPDARPNWATGAGVTYFTIRLDVRVGGLLPVESDVALLQPFELLGNADKACARP
jgi:hypothetical protein